MLHLTKSYRRFRGSQLSVPALLRHFICGGRVGDELPEYGAKESRT
jgi:hypothetical protein